MGDYIKWEDRFKTGDEEIDFQHQGLVTLINDIHKAVASEEKNPLLGEIWLEELVKYTKFHFNAEERLMESDSYPKDLKAEHLKQHQSFFAKVQDFKNKFENDEAELGPDILEFLKDWLINHIDKTDKELAGHLSK